ncbi:MAG: glycosyltransferase [Phycisphaerae bacterium]|nr:glycosyltransferase [Phycisphaerae bacterium]
MNLFDVTVIVPTHGRATKLTRCLSSLTRQKLPPGVRLECIVAIDGGVESRFEQPRELPAETLVLQLPRIGAAAARNAALRKSRGRIVIFTNDDTYAHCDWVKEHLAAHEIIGRPGMVLGETRWMDWPDANVMDGLVRDTSMIFFYDRLESGRSYGFRQFWTCNASAPRDMIDAVGGFEERLRPYLFEDIELAFRIEQSTGCGVYYHSAAANVHDHRVTWADYCHREACLGRMAGRLGAVNPACFESLYGCRDVRALVATYREWLQLDVGDHDAIRQFMEAWAERPLSSVEDWPNTCELLYRAHLPLKRRMFRAAFVDASHSADDSHWQERIAMQTVSI